MVSLWCTLNLFCKMDGESIVFCFGNDKRLYCQQPVECVDTEAITAAEFHPSHCMDSGQVATFQVHEYLRPKLCDMYGNDSIFDKFDCYLSGDGQQ
ncbi:hypothetical protein M8C21_014713, partial [Ambrosia artemisiifolia]